MVAPVVGLVNEWLINVDVNNASGWAADWVKQGWRAGF
jgi:hypothetical protein